MSMSLMAVNPSQVYTSEAFKPGTRGQDASGQEHIFGKAGEILTAAAVSVFDGSYTALMATTTTSAPDAGQGKRVGVCAVALALNEYGWFMIVGTTPVLGLADAVKFTELNTTATDGTLDDDATAGAEVINGIVFVTTIGGAPAVTSAVLNYPSVGRTL